MKSTLKTPCQTNCRRMSSMKFCMGADERLKIKGSLLHSSSDYFVAYEGIVKYIQMMQEKDASATAQKWAEQFAKTDCLSGV